MGKSIFVGYPPNQKLKWEYRVAAFASAKSRQCPSCQRKSALSTAYELDWGFVIRTCRWCDFQEERKVERAGDDGPAEPPGPNLSTC